MSARFEAAIGIVLAHEGGFVDDPADPGGATNWGVSLRWLKGQGDDVGDLDRDGDVDADDVRAMTRAQAAALYLARWWTPGRFDDYASAEVAGKAFDLTVNMGEIPAGRCLQRAIRAATGQALADDGKVGPATLAAMTRCAELALLAALRSEAAGHYRELVALKPARQRFLAGWLNRAYS